MEYSSSSGTKRGYILSSNVNTISNTGLGVTLKDITVYDDYVVNSGSLYKNEYFVITGYNDNYYRIEYNITTNAARKTGYVFKSDVQSINNDATIPKVSNSDAIHAKPKQSTSIYAGPSEKIYANIGSVDNSDTVGVLGKEGSYYYIQYSTASGSKRGYIQISALNSFSGSSSIGIIDGDNCKTGSNCQSIGRHNAVQMKHNDDGTWTKYTDGLGHIDLNRCFPNSADKSDFTPNYSDRYYTGPDPMMAYEAEALNELLQEYKSKTGIKYFIDIHGWTQQIIFAGESDKSPFVKAFRDHGFSNNTLTNTLATGGKGYVSRYAHYLGYQSCLFEFPSNTDSVDFYNGTYGNYFIESIKSLIDI